MYIQLKCIKTKTGRMVYDGGNRPFVDVGGTILGYAANIVDNELGVLCCQITVDKKTGSMSVAVVKDNVLTKEIELVPEIETSLSNNNRRTHYVQNAMNYHKKE